MVGSGRFRSVCPEARCHWPKPGERSVFEVIALAHDGPLAGARPMVPVGFVIGSTPRAAMPMLRSW